MLFRSSLNRARAIAGYFRSHGLNLPMFYQGFGETRLAVKTPDNKAEPANRRAEYILALNAPRGYGAGWKRF